jgi:glutamine synthetase adenylyltransferase
MPIQESAAQPQDVAADALRHVVMHVILPRLLRAFNQARQQHDSLPRLLRLINELNVGGTLEAAPLAYDVAHRIT